MSTFKEIQGRNIRSYTTNPDNPLEGQMWYNQTDQNLKGVVASGAWSGSSPQATSREGGVAVMGTLTAGLIAGGNSPSAPYTNATEEYNGSGWATGGNLGTGRNTYGGAGTQTAGLTAAGYDGSNNIAVSEEYNGTAWSEGNNVNTARRAGATCGTQTAGLLVGGYTSSPVGIAEEYDGSSWTTVTSSPTTMYSMGLAGIQTSAIQIAGSTNPGQACFEYDGTNWTTAGSLNTGRSGGGYSGTTQNSAMAISGETPPGTKTVNCEQYNGTSWSEINNVATARNPNGNSPGGSVTACYFSGGQSGQQLTEEYNFATTVITPGAWASGGSLNTARYGTAGAGTQTAALVAGGYYPPAISNASEEYNGSSWSEGNNLNTARMYVGGSGTQTAALASGGDQLPSPRYSILVEEYDGSSWTVQNTLPTQNKNMGSCGTQTATLSFGGSVPAATNVTNLYDGTNWTNTGHNLNTARFGLRGAGTSTAALSCGGDSNVNATEEYNGSSWTSVNNSVNNFDAHSSSGTQTAGAMFGGVGAGSGQTVANNYDGTTWSTAPSLATARFFASLGPIGTQSLSLIAGGNGSSITNVTEEFTGETTAANVKTFTTS